MIEKIKNYSLPEKKIQLVNVFLTFLISFYLIFHFLSHLFKFHYVKSITGFVSAISITFILLFLNKITRKYFYLTALYVLILVIWSSITQNNSILTYKWNYIIFIMLAAGFLVANGIFNSLISRILFIIMSLVFIYCYFIQTEVVIQGSYLFNMNRNYVSSYLMTLSSLIYITDYLEEKRKIVIWPALITLLLSIKSQSRTWLVISAILFITVFIFFYRDQFKKYFAEKIHKNKVFRFFLIFVMISMIVLIFLFILKHSRFATVGIMNSSAKQRLYLYINFFQELTFGNALSGFKSEYMILKGFRHLHNSFLQLWMYTGIAALPAFAAIAWMIHYYYRKAKFLLLILLLFCLACLSEAVFFFRYPDLILFSLWFIAINNTLEKETKAD